MAPVAHSSQEEDAFMSALLADDSFWNADVTPNPSPVKAPPKTPPKRPCETRKALPKIDYSNLLDGIDDWDVDFVSPQKPKKAQTKPAAKTPTEPPRPPYKGETCTRCVVETVEEGQREKHLIVTVVPGNQRRSVILKDDWVQTDARKGDIVNILGKFALLDESSSSITFAITISSKENYIILHPDTLLTATALSNAAQCRRRPLLSSLIRSSSDVTPALVWGNLLHTVLQSALVADRWDDVWMNDQIEQVVRNNLSDLLSINMSVDQAIAEIKTRAKGLQGFSKKYIAKEPKADANLTNTRALRNSASTLAITKVLDIEEDIWCPSHGLKGKMDATIDTTISEVPYPSAKPMVTKGPKPLEVKTGRSMGGMEHRAQTMLYTILAEQRYGIEVTSGLLYYTQSEEVVQVPVGRHELRALMIYRNEMATYISRRPTTSLEDSGSRVPFLPPTIDDERICKRCYVLDSCMLYRKAVEGVEDTKSPIADAYAMRTSHLSPSQAEFFKKWEHLIALEESDLGRFRKEIWTMGAAEREEKGRCFSSMEIDSSYDAAPAQPSARDTKIHQFTYKLIRSSSYDGLASLLSGFINIGDPVTISIEPHLLALARGFVLSLSPDSVVIGVDHELDLDSIRDRLSAFGPPPAEVVFRVDRDELFSGMGRIRENLARLFYADGDTRRLEIVVDLKQPVFQPAELPTTGRVAKHLEHLNDNQKDAIEKVLSAEDYALILGMPGTGKTTVIAAIIRVLAAMGKSVLLTSYTHSAVDTILMKLKDDVDFSVLRLGNVDKVHPDVKFMTLSAKKTPHTVEQLEQQVMTPLVVATTCLSIDHALFSRRTFDYCIVDEASQITLPTCLGPLRFADKFVLVGDHFQLPPLIRNHAARKGGLDVSLFRRLSDAHPEAVIDLNCQYRMNSDIMLLSNRLIYSDRLRCGSEEVAKQSLKLPEKKFLASIHGGKLSCHSKGCWLQHLLSEKCKAVFVDTDLVPARDSRVGDLVQNEVEASLVAQVTEALLRSGVSTEQIGILSLYRQQLKLLNQQLHHHDGLEMMTADRSQGRDKDCIIISMVRSNDDNSIGELVKDWRRMNVSFTRARSKLIIFGSRKTLQGTPLLKEFFELMDSRKWILQLPAGAHLSHVAAFGSVNGSQKRSVEAGKEAGRPAKKQKAIGEEGILRSRPILRDLVNDER